MFRTEGPVKFIPRRMLFLIVLPAMAVAAVGGRPELRAAELSIDAGRSAETESSADKDNPFDASTTRNPFESKRTVLGRYRAAQCEAARRHRSSETNDARRKVFSALTGVRWITTHEDQALTLYQDGTYAWSDIPKGFCGTPSFRRRGYWNFVVDDALRGQIYLTIEEPGRFIRNGQAERVVLFEIRDTDESVAPLVFGRREFRVRGPVDEDGRCDASTLPKIDPPENETPI